MFEITVTDGSVIKKIKAPKDEILMTVLQNHGFNINADCAGNGKCCKCRVKVDGKSVLSCEYRVRKNITVELNNPFNSAFTVTFERCEKELSNNTSVRVAADIGTTTVVLSFITDENVTVKKVAFLNPQKKYGADVMSRVAYCTQHGVDALQRALNSKINSCIELFCDEFKVDKIDSFVVCANTVILHTFFGVDCSCFATAPYSASFLGSQTVKGKQIGLEKVDNIISFPCAAPFFGADAVAGVVLLDSHKPSKPYLFLDLGTNAEIALVTEKAVFCTSAAAGPCFEGAEISHGTGAVNGAIKSCRINPDGNVLDTVGECNPTGICGSGLISAISEFLRNFIIDLNGTFCDDIDEYELTDTIALSQDDIRKFQNAKSAVRSAVEILLKESSTASKEITDVFIAGGFSEEMDNASFCRAGIVDKMFLNKCKGVSNTSLAAAEKYVKNEIVMPDCERMFKYIELNKHPDFFGFFIKHMNFD